MIKVGTQAGEKSFARAK